MSNSIYQINKGINKSIEFRGLKAQYIWYFGGGVMVLLLLFAGMYLVKINSYICVVVILALGTVLTVQVYAMSNKYGEHGLTKKLAARQIPKVIKLHDRTVFQGKQQHKIAKKDYEKTGSGGNHRRGKILN